MFSEEEASSFSAYDNGKEFQTIPRKMKSDTRKRNLNGLEDDIAGDCNRWLSTGSDRERKRPAKSNEGSFYFSLMARLDECGETQRPKVKTSEKFVFSA